MKIILHRFPLLPLIIVGFLLGACHTTFQPYEPADNSFKGQGGTKLVIDGIDFWENGTPPRRYRILGIIDDSRPSGPLPMASLQSDIAAKAQETGGDAVILMGADSQITGQFHQTRGNFSGSAHTMAGTTFFQGQQTQTGHSFPIGRHYGKYAVIQYLDE